MFLYGVAELVKKIKPHTSGNPMMQKKFEEAGTNVS